MHKVYNNIYNNYDNYEYPNDIESAFIDINDDNLENIDNNLKSLTNDDVKYLNLKKRFNLNKNNVRESVKNNNYIRSNKDNYLIYKKILFLILLIIFLIILCFL